MSEPLYSVFYRLYSRGPVISFLFFYFAELLKHMGFLIPQTLFRQHFLVIMPTNMSPHYFNAKDV